MESDVAEITFGDAARVLRIDLQADTSYVRHGSAERPLIVGRNIVLLGDPAIRLRGAGLADDRKDVDEGNRTGTLGEAFRRVGVPDVGENPAVGERDEDLRGL